MLDLKELISAVNQIAEERDIPQEKVFEVIEQAFASAYKKEYGKKSQLIRARFNPKTGEVAFWQVKLVVDKSAIYTEEELEDLKNKKESRDGEEEQEEKKVRFNLERHILLEDAQKEREDVKVEEELEFPLPFQSDFGRIAAQTAKQVILQKIKEIEKETIFAEFKTKEEEVVSGIVQRIESKNVFMDIGKALGILPKEEQVPGEFYRAGQRLKVFILSVENSPKGPAIFLSRAHPRLVSRLFELEVPEIIAGQVQIKSIAREPGSRSKVAVVSLDEKIDPIGATVGQRGSRVMTVISELGGEKIDIVKWSDDPKQFIANALSPAKTLEVVIGERNIALVIVPRDQLSLAIGKDGQNVRLAAKLTGWKIDVRGQAEPKEEEKEEKEKEEEGEEKAKEPTKVVEKAEKKTVKKPRQKTKKQSSEEAKEISEIK